MSEPTNPQPPLERDYRDDLQRQLAPLVEELLRFDQAQGTGYRKLLCFARTLSINAEDLQRRLLHLKLAPSTTHEILTIYASPWRDECIAGQISIREVLWLVRTAGKPVGAKALSRPEHALVRQALKYFEADPVFQGPFWKLLFVPSADAGHSTPAPASTPPLHRSLRLHLRPAQAEELNQYCCPFLPARLVASQWARQALKPALLEAVRAKMKQHEGELSALGGQPKSPQNS